MTGVNQGWKAGAIAAQGEFLTIDQDRAVVHIVAPQDEVIIKLSAELNKTYIPYGHQGARKQRQQVANDAHAESKKSLGASLQRAVSKASKRYKNTNWDLVDLAEEDAFAFSKVERKQLPKELQELSDEQLKARWL